MTEEPMSAVVERLDTFARTRAVGPGVIHERDLARLLSEYRLQRELIEEAKKSLEPFAECVRVIELVSGVQRPDETLVNFQLGEVRRARAVHARLKAAAGGE